jgi:hypothetical protein
MVFMTTLPSPILHVLAFEPNPHLTPPYLYFPNSFDFETHRKLSPMILKKVKSVPDLITVSTSFSVEQLVDFLWQLKDAFPDRVIPLLFIIDWSRPLIQIPGTTWGGKVGVLHSLSSQEEVLTIVGRFVPAL